MTTNWRHDAYKLVQGSSKIKHCSCETLLTSQGKGKIDGPWQHEAGVCSSLRLRGTLSPRRGHFSRREVVQTWEVERLHFLRSDVSCRLPRWTKVAVEYGRPRGLYTLTSGGLEMEWFGLKGVPATTGSLTTLFCLLTVIATPIRSGDDTEETNSNETERYQLVVWDFHHVEIPYVICLWILLASVAKIGEFLRWMSLSIPPTAMGLSSSTKAVSLSVSVSQSLGYWTFWFKFPFQRLDFVFSQMYYYFLNMTNYLCIQNGVWYNCVHGIDQNWLWRMLYGNKDFCHSAGRGYWLLQVRLDSGRRSLPQEKCS